MSLPGLGGDTSLRVLSLLATAGGLALITRAVARLAGRATGVAAGTVLACSPLVLEQAVEARSYGLAVLATGGAALGLVRWLQQPPRGLVLFGLAGAGMGLAHWYAVTVLAAFVVAALVLRGRRALPVVAVGAVAALPTRRLRRPGPAQRHRRAQRRAPARHRRAAAPAWPSRRGRPGAAYLLVVLVGLAVLGAVRARGLRVVGVAWLLVPLVLLTVAELVAAGLPAPIPAGRAARPGRARRRRRVRPPRPARCRWRSCSSG